MQSFGVAESPERDRLAFAEAPRFAKHALHLRARGERRIERHLHARLFPRRPIASDEDARTTRRPRGGRNEPGRAPREDLRFVYFCEIPADRRSPPKCPRCGLRHRSSKGGAELLDARILCIVFSCVRQKSIFPSLSANRTSYPAGQVSASMAKAILLFLRAEKGPLAADAWLKAINMQGEDLEDETKGLPISLLHVGLQAFVSVTSRATIKDDVWQYVLAADNLGFWMRVLRGTQTPGDAYARLEAGDSEYGRTERWETILSGRGIWRGRVHLAHDPLLEEDGLLALARLAQLRAVPALFGYGPGDVARGVTTAAKSEFSQEFEARWRVPSAPMSTLAGATLGGTLASFGWLVPATIVAGEVTAIAVGACAGALLGAAWARERIRRSETIAQTTRVHALERSITLRESRERDAAGQIQGAVVAGEYRIKQRMGSGGSGVIYEAERVRDGMRVAIKLLRAAAAHDAVASDRLRREAQALGLSWHPNVVEVIDHGHLPDGTAYLVMELLEGESLAAYVRNKERLTTEELLPMATEICDALVAVHAAGVVHRDLKPSNIFVERSTADRGQRVKILDFGIARVEWEETRITNVGAPVGTPGYMSPEQEVGGEVDARSDLFAFGCVLYECLVGEPPPPTPSGLWLAGPQAPSVVPRSASMKVGLSQIPPAWQDVIERALAPAPRDRFQDARAFAQALRALGGAVPVPVEATSKATL